MDADAKARTNGAARLGGKPRTESRSEDVFRQKSENRYQRLFETSHDGILLLDATTGKILDANPFMTRLLGLTHEEFLGRQLWEVGLVRDSDRRRGVLHDVSDQGVVRREEMLVQSPAHPYGMDVEVVSSSYGEGDHQVIQCHVRDITALKQADVSATHRAQELVVADRHKDEFLAMLSHELRNALAPVANALMILRLEQEASSPLPNRARALIERQVGNLSYLVDDLQEISSLGTGRMRLQPGVVDLRLIVQRSVEAVMSAHAHCRHSVSVTLPGAPVWLDADAIRLEQVVVNLMSNAAKYTRDGGSITVDVSQSAGQAQLRVADTGCGIPPGMLSRVFDLFTRAEDAREQSRNGLGIGLNIVKQIVDLHGGSVVARSDGLGEGSEFVVSLPLVLSAA
jgi:PAS domain S-box-containing protein